MKTFFAIISLCILTACSTIKYVPVHESMQTTTTYNLRDSIVFTRLEQESKEIHTKDSISVLETKYATSTAEIKKGELHHTLKNKKDSIQIRVVYKDKIIEKEIEKEVPVPVEVIKYKTPSWCWWLLILNILFIAFILIRKSLRI